METIYLTDITGTIGEWLETKFDIEVPSEVIDLLKKAYKLASQDLDKKSKASNDLLEDLRIEQKEQM